MIEGGISIGHKKRFGEIKKELLSIGAKESAFIKVELLFFEAMTIAREYGDDVEQNSLLSSLKDLQRYAYEDTKERFKKNTQREVVIRRFVHQFKAVLSSAAKSSKAASKK